MKKINISSNFIKIAGNNKKDLDIYSDVLAGMISPLLGLSTIGIGIYADNFSLIYSGIACTFGFPILPITTAFIKSKINDRRVLARYSIEDAFYELSSNNFDVSKGINLISQTDRILEIDKKKEIETLIYFQDSSGKTGILRQSKNNRKSKKYETYLYNSKEELLVGDFTNDIVMNSNSKKVKKKKFVIRN